MARTSFDFVISLKRPDYRAVNWVSRILLLIFIVAFFYYVVRTGFAGRQFWLAAIPLLICSAWVYGFVKAANPQYVVYHRLELMIAALGWFFIPLFAYSQLFGVAYAMLAIAERYIKFPDEIGFTSEKIVRNTFPAKTYQWFEIENVVIRDNLFTLDLRSNKLIQKPLDEPIELSLEKEFNEYCKKNLHFTDLERQV
jgi:hypothetical protein